MSRLTPQQKKRLSLAKDCRNRYGENDKSSRKNIPRRRARKHRQFRRNLNQALQAELYREGIDPEAVQTAALEARRDAWQKCPDTPLGETIEQQKYWRDRLANRKVPNQPLQLTSDARES